MNLFYLILIIILIIIVISLILFFLLKGKDKIDETKNYILVDETKKFGVSFIDLDKISSDQLEDTNLGDNVICGKFEEKQNSSTFYLKKNNDTLQNYPSKEIWVLEVPKYILVNEYGKTLVEKNRYFGWSSNKTYNKVYLLQNPTTKNYVLLIPETEEVIYSGKKLEDYTGSTPPFPTDYPIILFYYFNESGTFDSLQECWKIEKQIKKKI